ncbi:MAG TPA: type II secretion system F family protein [Geminicoccaceae bacterium]|nr:type II secretion system F family protein [Geminicoccaceae bacterium]
MGANVLLFLYALLFIGILLLVDGAFQLLGDPGGKADKAINRRLRMLASGSDPEQVLKLLRRPMSEGTTALMGRLRRLLNQGGLRCSPEAALALGAGTSLAAGLAANTVLPLPLAMALGPGLGLGLPFLVLRARRNRRHVALMQQLPDALDLVVRSLRAGHPLNAALGAVAQEMADPIGSEVGIVVDEITYGMSLTQAVESMASRIGLEDLQYVAVAIKIQHGTGGNLADILSSLSRVIRARFAMRRRIQAISAEGRISASILSCCPPALAGVILLVSPSYFLDVAGDPLFTRMIYFVTGLIGLNWFVMRRMVNFHF